MAQNDERKLVVRGTDRVHFALGILGLESDYENLELKEEE